MVISVSVPTMTLQQGDYVRGHPNPDSFSDMVISVSVLRIPPLQQGNYVLHIFHNIVWG